jgi:hypothetical protein
MDEDMVAEATKRISAGVIQRAGGAVEKDRQAQMASCRATWRRWPTVSGSMDPIMNKMFSEVMEAHQGDRDSVVTELLITVITTLKKEVGPIDFPTVETVGKGAREVTKQITLGFQDAIDQTRRDRKSGAIPESEGSVLFGVGELAENGQGSMLNTIAGGFAALILAIAGMLWWVSRRFRAHQPSSASATRPAAADRSHQVDRGWPWATELRQTITDNDKEAGEHLRRVLRNHRDLRLGGNA